MTAKPAGLEYRFFVYDRSDFQCKLLADIDYHALTDERHLYLDNLGRSMATRKGRQYRYRCFGFYAFKIGTEYPSLSHKEMEDWVSRNHLGRLASFYGGVRVNELSTFISKGHKSMLFSFKLRGDCLGQNPWERGYYVPDPKDLGKKPELIDRTRGFTIWHLWTSDREFAIKSASEAGEILGELDYNWKG